MLLSYPLTLSNNGQRALGDCQGCVSACGDPAFPTSRDVPREHFPGLGGEHGQCWAARTLLP